MDVLPHQLQVLLQDSVVSWPHPNRERILDVVQEGRSSKLRVSWRARLTVPTCNNSKHLAYMSLLRISRNTGTKKQKERGLWKPEFSPLRSTSRLVKDGAETALFVYYSWEGRDWLSIQSGHRSRVLMILTLVPYVTVSYNTRSLKTFQHRHWSNYGKHNGS